MFNDAVSGGVGMFVVWSYASWLLALGFRGFEIQIRVGTIN